MSVPTFAARKKAWSSPPVDDIGYIPAADLLAMNDTDFRRVIDQATTNRYSGWRNYRDRWTDILTRWDTTENQWILDYGCGIGLEGLLLARHNHVHLADISLGNLAVAERAFQVNGLVPAWVSQIKNKAPFLNPAPVRLNIILCLGVLHHIPQPVPVVRAMHGWLATGGELRLMVYSAKAWTIATGTLPPRDMPVEDHPEFERYWRHWDPIGGYADWYDWEKLIVRFGDLFTVRHCEPLTERGEYLGAVLVKK